MKPESSLPWSQQHATGAYPEPDEFSTLHHSLFFKINFNIIAPSAPRYSKTLSDLFTSGFPAKILYAFLVLSKHEGRTRARVIWTHLKWNWKNFPGLE
jgi:hypothetical protein